MVKVKVCGITCAEDLLTALDAGADAVGFVLEPSSPRYVGDIHFDILFKLAEPFSISVAVFGQLARPVPFARAIQGLAFDPTATDFQAKIQAIRVKPGQTVEEVVASATTGAAVLLDAHSEGAFGGTGKIIDWEVAAGVTQRLANLGRPTILAGGLNPDNVADAVRQVRPYAVDVSSGVELSPGKKDVYKVRDFIAAAKGALV